MGEQTSDIERRTVLQAAAGLAVAATAPGMAAASPVASPAVGRPGDFDFLAGAWTIHHRRLKSPGDWDVFEGEATCWSILGGVGSIEELRIPARNFSGSGIRLLDVEKQVWNDFWVNARSGVLAPPGMPGVFENGVGTFTAEDMDGETPILVRGIWDRITGASCRWRQAVSRDKGGTWEENWLMDWTRV